MYRFQDSNSRYVLVATLFVGLFCHTSTVLAKPEKDSAVAMKEAHAKLVSLLDEIDDLFYKKKTDDNGNVFYSVIWEANGETSKIILVLKELGHYQNDYIYSMGAWAYVATAEEPLPPAAIKAVATANDALLIGSFSCSKDFKQVYANMTGILGNATPGSIWMYFAYLHSNRLALKEQVNQAMAGAGR